MIIYYMVSIRINIAHYCEDLGWLDILRTKGYELLIYEKKTDLSGYDEYIQLNNHQVLLANIGREAHTYLYHIVKKYDHLRDYEVFFQGRVDDHMDGCPEDNLKDLIGKDYLSWCTQCKTKIGCFTEEVYKQIKNKHPNHKHINKFYSRDGLRDYLFFKDTFPNLPLPNEGYYYNAFALFGVKKEVIQYYPKEFYEKLLNYFNPKYNNFMNMDPYEFSINMAYTFEVFWDFIFKHAANQLKENIKYSVT